MNYLTMICDIKNSKGLKNRESFQYKLIDTLKEANSKFSNVISSPFIITLGDEWQGLLSFPCNYNDIISYFSSSLKPVQFYCGIGIGDVSIHDFELTVNQLDGPSFYNARNAIKIAKRKKYSLVLIQ